MAKFLQDFLKNPYFCRIIRTISHSTLIKKSRDRGRKPVPWFMIQTALKSKKVRLKIPKLEKQFDKTHLKMANRNPPSALVSFQVNSDNKSITLVFVTTMSCCVHRYVHVPFITLSHCDFETVDRI